MTRIVTRASSPADAEALMRHGLHPVIARLYASRGVTSPDEVETEFKRLHAPAGLKGCDAAAVVLADALARASACWSSRTTTATARPPARSPCAACACSARHIDYLVPNRFEYGYGLTPEIVELAARSPTACPIC